MKALLAVALLLGVWGARPAGAQTSTPPADRRLLTATFAGGCFWCMEEAFEKVGGVVSVTSGYTGGAVRNPGYEQVSSGDTGHAESVEVRYDPEKITYQGLLDVFWHNIDPLVKDRQFCDVGSQYRSADRDRACRTVLSRRDLSPGLLQEEPGPLQVLQVQLRAGPAAGSAVGK